MSGARHLVLIGLMGAGKTTVGRECASELGRGCVDTDELVRITSGMTVPEIFASEGESGFRARERFALAEAVAGPEPLVIACGGGAMVDPENRRAVRECHVVWLDASPKVLAGRVEGDGIEARPLLADGPTTATLTRLADSRRAAYAAAADAVVDTGNRTVDAVVAERPASILEVGCGQGWLLRLLADAAPEAHADLLVELSDARAAVRAEKISEVAAEFDAVHSIHRAVQVGSVDKVISLAELRPGIVATIEAHVRG